MFLKNRSNEIRSNEIRIRRKLPVGLKIELLFWMHQIHSDSQQKSIGKGPYMSEIFNINLNTKNELIRWLLKK